ncbi:putative DUF1705 domain-containing protein [Alphaproteobacteria bacterium]
MMPYKFLDKTISFLLKNTKNVFFIAVAYAFLFYLPIIVYALHVKVYFSEYIQILIEGLTAVSLIFVIFLVASLNKRLLYTVVTVLYGLGGFSIYFFINFKQPLTYNLFRAVIHEDRDFIGDLLSRQALFLAVIAAIIGFFLLHRLEAKISDANSDDKARHLFVRSIAVLSIILLIYGHIVIGRVVVKNVLTNYQPFPLIYYALFSKNIHTGTDILPSKVDISKLHQLHHNMPDKKPLTVILIIGGSLRGDILEINGYRKYENTPKMMRIENFISFKNATSSATTTQISIPYILTRNSPPYWKKAIRETTVISIFKELGFKTAWIGMRSVSLGDRHCSSIPLEAEYLLTKSDIRDKFGSKFKDGKLYDESLIPLVMSFINENKDKNKFLVAQMQGSHWMVNLRYPGEFYKFHPECHISSVANCTPKMLENNYHNSVLYTDFVLDELITQLRDENVFLIFASDHGSYVTGRYFDAAMYENIPEKALVNIGMFVWGSQEFLTRYGNNFERIRGRANDAVSHSNIFHSLLGCLNIDSPLIRPELNLCK